jgi:putative spermidine/putrescine transport system permease protein
METRSTRIGLGVATVAVIAFLWLPLLLIMAYAFNSSTIQTWPISGFTFTGSPSLARPEVRSSLWLR